MDAVGPNQNVAFNVAAIGEVCHDLFVIVGEADVCEPLLVGDRNSLPLRLLCEDLMQVRTSQRDSRLAVLLAAVVDACQDSSGFAPKTTLQSNSAASLEFFSLAKLV